MLVLDSMLIKLSVVFGGGQLESMAVATLATTHIEVTVNNNSPIQDYVHPDDQTQSTFEMTPGFKPFTIQHSVSFVLFYLISH